jgi:hypothetical protein
MDGGVMEIVLQQTSINRIEKLEARAAELKVAIARGQHTIYTTMLRAELGVVLAAIDSAWVVAYFEKYIGESGFKPYMGGSYITKYELPEDDGKTIHVPLITRVKGAGVTASQVLTGTEEELANYNCALSLDWRKR